MSGGGGGALAGAFAAGGSGLKETKQEKRERLELAELKALEAAPSWSTATLLSELRAAGSKAEAQRVPLSEAPIFGTQSTPRAVRHEPASPADLWVVALFPRLVSLPRSLAFAFSLPPQTQTSPDRHPPPQGGGNDVRDAILHARAIARFENAGGLRATRDEPDGTWFLVQPPKPAGWSTEEPILCVGMTKAKTLCGAVGSWPKALLTAPKNGTAAPLRVEDATRIVLIDDDASIVRPGSPGLLAGSPSQLGSQSPALAARCSPAATRASPALGSPAARRSPAPGTVVGAAGAVTGAETYLYPPMAMGHPTVSGVGEDHTRPASAASDLLAPVPLHVCEAVRLHLVAKVQVGARLQRGGASDDEKAYARLLLKEGFGRVRKLVKEGSRSFAGIDAQVRLSLCTVLVMPQGTRGHCYSCTPTALLPSLLRQTRPNSLPSATTFSSHPLPPLSPLKSHCLRSSLVALGRARAVPCRAVPPPTADGRPQ